jgi:hypothetical protein
MQGLEEDKSRRGDLRAGARRGEDRERLLEERFEEAMRQAGDLDDVKRPPRPFDLD